MQPHALALMVGNTMCVQYFVGNGRLTTVLDMAHAHTHGGSI